MNAAPDYKELYLELFRANEQAVRALISAQQHAEQQVLHSAPPPLRLNEQVDDEGDKK